MGGELLPELKRKLREEKQFSETWRYFLDHFAENEEFLTLGHPVEHDFLGAVVAQIAAQLYGPNVEVAGVRVIRLDEEEFVHGAMFVGGRPGGLFFFENDNVGLACVCDGPPTNNNHFARITGISPEQLRRLQRRTSNPPFGTPPSRN